MAEDKMETLAFADGQDPRKESQREKSRPPLSRSLLRARAEADAALAQIALEEAEELKNNQKPTETI